MCRGAKCKNRASKLVDGFLAHFRISLLERCRTRADAHPKGACDWPNPFLRSTSQSVHWDDDTVVTGLNLVRDKIQSSRGAKAKWPDNGDVARELGIQKPANWDWPEKVNANKLAFAWADEILPLAREAHERLEYSQVFFPKGNEKLARGYATERAIKAGQLPYRDWSGGVVRDKLHVAGWRLAALLDSVLE
jgi:hypothetical protein